ncbi:hypothetical protein ABB37_09816 [Leptomonas pyrrhocoris]|uniref:Uncharacterized protein n=1 Tax=Leptomonas pyrrhocoris TaxID=157538 RepID=A0A0M9FPM2_LEPPY|nr:hypothetical protein ABB37_09816 [Leptomonas pyrrhocoris]KPA73500.1 hypothetical protein ABB37_09816 [Leptomonas pyrrhocoris]|eukprot:XP_015651939.1 hypothetical protein ABB37_09816 [Leptomonas pyrrhocoris]
MNGTTEAQFDAAWGEVERQQKAQISQKAQLLEQDVDKELALLLSGVRESLTEDQRDIQGEFDKLIRMVEQFREGVDLWQLKAKSSIKMIEEKQRSFAILVEETSIRAAALRRDAIDRLQRRAAETEQKCHLILSSASLGSA